MTNQGDRQDFFRAISGTSTDYNGDFLAAAATEGFTGEFNGVFIQWLQDRTGSSATNLDGLKQEFAELAGAHNWESTGGVPIILEGCQLWLDADDSSTIIESSDLVHRWNDKSGKGNDATQGTGLAQPATNATTQNSKNVLDFDGGDYLSVSSLASVMSGADKPVTLFHVTRATDISVSQYIIIWGRDTSSAPLYGNRYESSSIEVIKRDDAATLKSDSGGTPVNNVFNIISDSNTGTASTVNLNGAEVISAGDIDVGTTTLDNFTVGASDRNGSVSLNLTGSIAEIIIYDRALSAAEIASVQTYLSPKWGITLA